MHNLLPEYQSAYRKFYSCETSLLKLVNGTLLAMEKKQITAVLIMALSASFDTVDHNLLLNLLHRKFSITNTALKWYNNFLIPRKFRVCINGSSSSDWVMNFGLPQGSTEGAYLFNFYALTLSEIVPDSLTLNGFTDDHSIRRKPTLTEVINHHQKTIT